MKTNAVIKSKKQTLLKKGAEIILFCALVCFPGCRQNMSLEKFEEEQYKNLQDVLEDTRQKLSFYLDQLEKKAVNIRSDKVLTTFFMTKKEYYSLQKGTVIPQKYIFQIENLKKQIQHHYLLHYQSFYDILFIDKNGDVFYTIRKEKDYHKNIFQGELAKTTLSKKLKGNPTVSFIDFQFYTISGEPSAFFIEPVISNNNMEGWFVLQCAVNKINQLFQEHADLGQTGEVILVNKDHFLLTNSRFEVHNSTLKQKLPDDNITQKFEERKGVKNVVDYRNKEVISSFEVYPFLNTEWLMIAKKDRAEIVTNFYKEHNDWLYDAIAPLLVSPDIFNAGFEAPLGLVHVDMDEFQRSDTNNVLATQGISTCTAITVSYPGKFSYMAHISPYDYIYGESHTDLLGNLLKKISYFDITESEKSNLEFQVVSTVDLSFKNCIDLILDKGYFLSQLKLMYNPHAKYGNMYHDVKTNKTIVNWNTGSKKPTFVSQSFDEQKYLYHLLINEEI